MADTSARHTLPIILGAVDNEGCQFGTLKIDIQSKFALICCCRQELDQGSIFSRRQQRGTLISAFSQLE